VVDVDNSRGRAAEQQFLSDPSATLCGGARAPSTAPAAHSPAAQWCAYGTTPARGDWRGPSVVQLRGVELNRCPDMPDTTNCSPCGAATRASGRTISAVSGAAETGSGKLGRVPGALLTPPSAPSPTGSGSAAFFDLDKTIIAGSSALAFSRPFRRQGLINRRAVVRSAYAQLLLVLAGADADTMELLRRRLTALCTGWEVAQIRSIVAETLHDIVEPLVYAEATELIAEHRANGDEVVVLSASGLEVVEPIAALVGADRCLATRMGVADGRYTGAIDYYCYGEEKARAARLIADERGYRLADCRAYSDSITDLPLLEAVGHPTVVNPDRALRREAEQRGWPILTFADPVALRMRFRPRPRMTLAAAGLGTAAALAAWYLLRGPARS
jgi:HAD superfamily hydrolase (TIGR01490 family)